MEVIVCKFGGSSTADANMFRQIRRILNGDARRRYVVLSAPGGRERVTDLLCCGWLALREGRDAAPLINAVVARFEAISSALGLSGFGDEVRRELLCAMQTSEAMTVSRGEALCARLFSRWSGLPFQDADVLVRFDAEGRPDVPDTLARFRDWARNHSQAVLPGFYGGGPDGKIFTFPRNGSDITGALCAAGVGAAVYENWSDVPGLMTADPATDPEARLIPEITYPAMCERCRLGARVLHPDSLVPLEAAGIPTRLRCTMNPEAPGTWIH